MTTVQAEKIARRKLSLLQLAQELRQRLEGVPDRGLQPPAVLRDPAELPAARRRRPARPVARRQGPAPEPESER